MNVITFDTVDELPIYTGVPLDKLRLGHKFLYAGRNWEVRSVNPPQIRMLEASHMEVTAENLQSDPTPFFNPQDVHDDPYPQAGQAASGGYAPGVKPKTGPQIKTPPDDHAGGTVTKEKIFPSELKSPHPPGYFVNTPVVPGELSTNDVRSSMDAKARKVWAMLGIITAKRNHE